MQDLPLHVDRRAFLQLPGLAAAPALMPIASPAFAGDAERFAPLDFDRFQDEWAKLAAARLGPDAADSAPDAYLFALTSLVARLPLDQVPEGRKAYESEGLASGPCWFGKGFGIVELRLAPGYVIAPHNHTAQEVVTVGRTGMCTFRHFDIQGDVPNYDPAAQDKLTLRETHSGVLDPRRSSNLSLVRDNVHMFRAGAQGARILDFMITLPEPEGAERSGIFLEVAPEQTSDSIERMFQARQIASPYA